MAAHACLDGVKNLLLLCIGQEMFVINQLVYFILWYHENVLISYHFDNLDTHSLVKLAGPLRPNVLIQCACQCESDICASSSLLGLIYLFELCLIQY